MASANGDWDRQKGLGWWVVWEGYVQDCMAVQPYAHVMNFDDFDDF